MLISPSQYDTEIDGRLHEDGNGNLIVDVGFRDLFDYFFSALGEKTAEQIAADMEQYIDGALSPRAAEQARALLKMFIAYNRDLAEYTTANNTDVYNLHGRALVDYLKAYQAYLADTRMRHFGREYSDLFFGSEEKYQAYTIARMELGLTDLPDEERKRQIEELRSQLPEKQQEIIRNHERMNEFMSREQAWQDEGVSGEELYDRRLANYGYDAAQRMAALDESNRRWQSRLNDFFQEVDQISATDWPEADKKDLIEGIKVSSFSETERLRVNVIERYRQKNNNSQN
ncbi:lipase secretion chaperone [Desulfosudis oleivorans]|nr:lipase secretion chaperone [Desulfosudis oleivorans]